MALRTPTVNSETLFSFHAGESKISFMDFIQILMKIKSSHQDDSDLLEAFEVFDREKKGFFRLAELEDTLTKIPGSDPLTECELAEILQLADPDGDGRVHFEGLCDANKNMQTPDTRRKYPALDTRGNSS